MLTKIELERSSPERQGVASSAIVRLVEWLERLHEFHSFMLLRHGRVIAEGWWSPYGRDYPHMLFSVSKSFTSTAVGFAVSEGRFSIDDRVLSFFPDEMPTQVSEHLAGMQVCHLLTMSTGHAVDTWANMFGRSDGQWIKGFFEVPIVHAPGSHFLYNTGASYLLAAIVQKTTGMKLVDYLTPRLFAPLGIESARWQESPEGIAMGGIGLSLKTEDLARFGQLYLQKGMWQGKQLLPEAWIAEATVVQMPSSGVDSDWVQGYGYQFWRCRHGAYRADGVFGQYCIVMPEQDAVLAITGGMDAFDAQLPLELVWEILLPAMGDEPLPEDDAAQNALAGKLASLNLPPVQGQAASPLAAAVSGRVYVMDENEFGIETIALNFNESGCLVRIHTTTGEEMFPCGYGGWQQGKTSLFNQGWLFEPARVVASGGWITEDRFMMGIQLYETPFRQMLGFHFDGSEMMIETWVNVSFESMERRLMTGRME